MVTCNLVRFQVSKIHARHIYGWVWIIILGSGLGMDSTNLTYIYSLSSLILSLYHMV